MPLDLDVWVIPKHKKVEVSDLPGVPTSICGYVSDDAEKAATERGGATVSEIGFPAECYLGSFDDWDQAWNVAKAKAAELGYEAVDATSLWDLGDEDPDTDEWDVHDWDEFNEDLEDEEF